MNKPKLYIDESSIRAFMEKHDIKFIEKKRNRLKILALEHCAFNENHVNGESAIIISENGIVKYDCKHDSCKGKDIIAFVQHYEPDYFKDDQINAGKSELKKPEISFKRVKDIQESDIPPIGYSVAGIVPNGYTVISAAFKIGKSWLVLWICTRVAQGLPVWGMPTEKGSVLYLDLEGCDNHTKERINIILQGEPAPDNFYVAYDAPTLDDGLIEYLEKVYKQIPNLRLIVIDVLAMVQYQPQRGESAYKNDYRTGTALKHFADEKKISIVAVTHTTKALHPNDIFMNTTGTNGVTASADAIITIAKAKREDKNALMAVIGRRVREHYFNIHLDDNCIWQLDGNAEDSEGMSEELKQQAEYEASEIREAVIAIAKSGTIELRARGIIEKALELNVYITKGAKEVGLFMHKNQVRFVKFDNVKISIIRNGQGSSLYRIEYVGDPDPEYDPVPFPLTE